MTCEVPLLVPQQQGEGTGRTKVTLLVPGMLKSQGQSEIAFPSAAALSGVTEDSFPQQQLGTQLFRNDAKMKPPWVSRGGFSPHSLCAEVTKCLPQHSN